MINLHVSITSLSFRGVKLIALTIRAFEFVCEELRTRESDDWIKREA